ncbi:acetyl esterase/lipase [Spinactinospora alkalitolerans]|uniref:Acetyl esterase/lipase n=1 Tax=Spinactinospora alkalitolerans TaxID=687207 RepID=A0A852TXD2_9ACTN|nr:prolyl oligopeptidase family serine peptidase [Spinactinospora alkalitolerans]NYE48401.1 acetyl esterase/lipase [Spinactinospora alkalitolerans]
MALSPRTISYGRHPSEVVHLWQPTVFGTDPLPVAVLLHGGWWRDRHDARLMDPLAADLASTGWLVCNAEYRRTGDDGGGWPRSRDDVLRAIRSMRTLLDSGEVPVDFGAVVAIGHSAGGHLALLAALELPLAAVVALAPVTDLRRCAEAGLGEDAVPDFLGARPSRRLYHDSSPLHRLPIGRPQLVVHGDADHRVPVEHSRDYVGAARAAGDPVDYHEVAGADHFAVIDPSHRAWRGVRDWLAAGHHPDRTFVAGRSGIEEEH